ncbi:Imm8 family immunity protein [Neptuniibacter sp. PT34_22]|uniref:Imm8 family immunity protein n=1 Tax=Neptuniibacter sp. PT34_22 TaxID=3398205 RepID=UPI0039F5997C
MIHVTDFVFDDPTIKFTEEYETWQPRDSEYLDEWVQILVGTKKGEGHWFQVHICTYQTMPQLSHKEHLFPIPHWVSVQDLIDKLDKFITDILPDNLNLENDHDYGLAMANLAKYWNWEYAEA